MNMRFFVLVLLASKGYAATWDDCISSKMELLKEKSILPKQYLSFVMQQSPTIADSKIKAIPILENGEDLIDLLELEDDRLQMLPSPKVPFEHAFFNSGMPNASKMRIGLYHKLQNMVLSLDSLSYKFGYQPGQICIRVFEALRDVDTQNMLFNKKLKEILVRNPLFTMEEAEIETAIWVSPVKNNIPVHSTGAAIDIRLWDTQNQEFLDMGPFGVIWGLNETAPTFSENISDEQKNNRLYCLLAAEQAGLTNYSYEFWHFSNNDRYAIYWTRESEHASYGSIHEK